jgi:hypothetical protein
MDQKYGSLATNIRKRWPSSTTNPNMTRWVSTRRLPARSLCMSSSPKILVNCTLCIVLSDLTYECCIGKDNSWPSLLMRAMANQGPLRCNGCQKLVIWSAWSFQHPCEFILTWYLSCRLSKRNQTRSLEPSSIYSTRRQRGPYRYPQSRRDCSFSLTKKIFRQAEILGIKSSYDFHLIQMLGILFSCHINIYKGLSGTAVLSPCFPPS